MAVHNGERYLDEALRSVLTQTFADFEFVILDDGSSDGTADLLAEVAVSDTRVKLLRNAENLGLTRSLNVGLRYASGTYVARIDADDICLPERLARQHQFLEDNPDYVAVACGHHTINHAGHTVSTTAEGLDDWQIRWLSGFNPPAPHPTYFFKRLQADNKPYLYDETFQTAQDFDLWSRLSLQGKTSVIPDVLVKYRRHAEAISVQKRRVQAQNCRRTGIANLSRRLPPEIVINLGPMIDLFAYETCANQNTIAGAVAGCDAMLAHDLDIAPTNFHKSWIRKMTAGLLADAVLSRGGGLQSAVSTTAFIIHARKHLHQLLLAIASNPNQAIKGLRNVGAY